MYTTFGILTLRRNFTPSPSPPLGEESPPRRSMRRIRRKTADELNYHYPQISPEETGRGGGRGGEEEDVDEELDAERKEEEVKAQETDSLTKLII